MDREAFYGRLIVGAEQHEDDGLMLELEGGERLRIYDGGQSCCEHRYMRTDDQIRDLVGKRLAKIETKDAPSRDDGIEDHDVRFLEVGTSDGDSVTFSFHNEYNGYYGGFSLQLAADGISERLDPNPWDQ